MLGEELTTDHRAMTDRHYRPGRNATAEDRQMLAERLARHIREDGYVLDWTDEAHGATVMAVSPPDGYAGMMLVGVYWRGSGVGRALGPDNALMVETTCEGCGTQSSFPVERPRITQCSNCPPRTVEP